MLDTGLLFLLLNPQWANRGMLVGEAAEYRFWGKPYAARKVKPPRLEIPGTPLSADISADWSLLSLEKRWCHNRDGVGCGGYVGGEVLGHVAKEVHHRSAGELCLTEGPCRNWLRYRSPLPLVTVEVEGTSMDFLFDSGAIETRVFHPTQAPKPHIVVPGLPEPLVGAETSEETLDNYFGTQTLNGITFDGVIGWKDIRRTDWSWNPCKGTVDFHGYLDQDQQPVGK